MGNLTDISLVSPDPNLFDPNDSTQFQFSQSECKIKENESVAIIENKTRISEREKGLKHHEEDRKPECAIPGQSPIGNNKPKNRGVLP